MVTKNKKRGRPSAFDKDVALVTAMHLFHAKGYDAVGIAELSNAMEIKPPSLYAAFGNKAHLYEKTLELYAANEGQFMRHSFDQATSIKEGLRAMLISAVEQYSLHEDRLGCMVMDGAHCTSDTAASSTSLNMCRATQTNVADYIASQYPDVADVAAKQIMIALAGLSASARTGAAREDLLRFAKNIADPILSILD